MEKPRSLSLREALIKRLSLRENISENIIRLVLNHQMDELFDHLKTCNSLEISGWGTLKFREKRALFLLDKYQSQERLYLRKLQEDILPPERKKIEKRLQTALDNIAYLKPKLQ